MSKDCEQNSTVLTKTFQSSNKGIYCLIIFLSNSQKIIISKRICFFPKGYYCYVGSALNNLDKRIARHKSKNKKMHWHIDYFLEHGKIIGVDRLETKKKLECELSKRLNSLTDCNVVMKGFGSSDCKCQTHLYHFKKNELKEVSLIINRMNRIKI